MSISNGATLPTETLMRVDAAGEAPVTLAGLSAGKRIVVFAVPGAFTPTCDSSHLPSFIRTMPGFAAKGIDTVACLSVNDIHVMRAWGKASGAYDAGIVMLSDPSGAFTAAAGLSFDVPQVGLIGRSKRYAMVVEDGVVTFWAPEPDRGCAISGGEALLEAV